MKFYVLGEHDSTDAYVVCDDDGVPQAFDSEEAATDRAKTYTPALVLRAVSRVTDRTTHKVEKLK